VSFRFLFEFKRRCGLLKLYHPIGQQFERWISFEKWHKEAAPFFFKSRLDFLSVQGSASDELTTKAHRIFRGEVQFFQGEWRKIETEDWMTNWKTGHRYDIEKHWTEIPDFHPVYGDIKYVWERSRFSFVQIILRYDALSGVDSSEWIFSQIDSWIKNNPINQGPNYRCSQEMSLRVFNWILVLYFYRDSRNLTEARFQQLIFHIYWHLRHIRSNIHFSRIAVRNNHAITETLCLYTAGLLFPFFQEAKEWKASGKKWFEEEITYQVYSDGSYLQFSHNYHRVVIQLLTWAVSLASIHKEKFKDEVYQRALASINLLANCQDSVSGQLPNYGANDSSLFFQWNDCFFRDYRPSLDALHFILTGKNLYTYESEDRLWFGLSKSTLQLAPVEPIEGTFSFEQGGIYGYRGKDILICMCCTNYKNRPSQADALHLDIWYKGKNVLRDAGSYLYNTTGEKVKYFFGTESHNTVMIEDNDQMLKGPRFIWLDWSEAFDCAWKFDGSKIIFNGSALVYKYFGDINHKRSVVIDQATGSLTITDQVSGTGKKRLRQLWHLDPGLKDSITFKSLDGSEKVTSMKFFSPVYGVLEDSLQVEFQSVNSKITTQINFS